MTAASKPVRVRTRRKIAPGAFEEPKAATPKPSGRKIAVEGEATIYFYMPDDSKHFGSGMRLVIAYDRKGKEVTLMSPTHLEPHVVSADELRYCTAANELDPKKMARRIRRKVKDRRLWEAKRVEEQKVLDLLEGKTKRSYTYYEGESPLRVAKLLDASVV